MKLNSELRNLTNTTWTQVYKELDLLDGQNNGFISIENRKGDYVQAAGNKKNLTVEYRTILDNGFKHFVLGLGGNKSPLKVTWVNLETRAGDIMLHDDEVMNIEHATKIFKEFFLNGSIPPQFNKRNVTKHFL